MPIFGAILNVLLSSRVRILCVDGLLPPGLSSSMFGHCSAGLYSFQWNGRATFLKQEQMHFQY